MARDDQDLFERVEASIVRASEIDDTTRFLIYGRSGAGKTRLAATAPDCLLIDINEKGTKSVRRDLNPWVYPVELWSEIQDIFWYLEGGNHKHKSVAIDSITAMQNLCIKFVLGDETARDASRDPDMMSRPAWGKVGELMKTSITNFRNLPMNVIFTALQRSRTGGEDDLDAESVITPSASPSVAGHLEAAVDIIGHLSPREVIVKRKVGEEEKKVRVIRRRLLVGPSERYITKDRTGVLGNHVDRPDLGKMIEEIHKREEE